MKTFAKQLQYVVRQLARYPVFTTVSVVTLAVGIGANTAIFSVVNGVLLKPLPFEEPERLVGVWHTAPGLGFDEVNQSPALYFTYRDEGETFEDTGMWDWTTITITGLDEPERINAMLVTDGTLPILRAQPMLGRTFSAEDDLPGKPETVILSYAYWQRRFGGDRGVLGQTLQVDGRPREIIGVMPETFYFLRYRPEVFLPFQFDRTKVFMGNFSFQGLARLRPGVTLEQANADVARLIPVAVENFPGGLTMEMMKDARFGPNIHPLKEDVVGDVGKVLWVLLGTVGLVLLIACANVANLFLVRADGRQQELAVRTALGADRKQIAKELLLESVSLGFLGGLLGLVLAFGGLRLLLALSPENLPRQEAITVDGVTLAFAFTVSILAGLLFGLVPILKYGGPNMVHALKEGGRASSDGRERHRARGTLVVSQIALALVLLIGSGLMIRSFQALRQVHPGFMKPEELLSFRVSIPEAEVEDGEQAVFTHEQILRKVEQIPGVTSAGLSTSVTMDGWDSNDAVYVEEFPVPDGQLPPIRRFKWVSENYFETMGNPLVAGRTITWTDIRNHAPVVMVTENFTREYWDVPTDAIGKRIKASLDDPWREIVGVVGNVHDDGVNEKATPIVYWPLIVENMWGQGLETRRNVAYAVRSKRAGTQGFLQEIRQAVWSMNSNLPIARVRTLEEIVDRSMARTSFTLIMLGIAAAVAILLGAVGIYGVISYAVSQRTREIGVRVALGAQQGDVSRLVLRQGAFLAVLGVVVGLGAAFGLTRLMSALLFGVDPVDPMTYALAAVVLSAIALMASYFPARRAASVDPMVALRWE
jgi:predicted permease